MRSLSSHNRLTTSHLWIAILVCTLGLLPLCFQALSSDQIIFVRGGQALLEGKKLYADYIDIKTPMFFDVFAGISAICGSHSQLSLVILYCILVAVTTLLATRIIRRFSASVFWTWLSLTILCSVAMIRGVCYPEVLMLLPLCIAFELMQSSSSSSRLIVIGVCLGLVMSLKYSVIVSLALPWLVKPLEKNRRSTGQNLVIVLVAFLTLALSHHALVDAETRSAFILVTDYMRFYNATDNSISTLLTTISENSWGIATRGFSLLVCISCFGVLVTSFRNKSNTTANNVGATSLKNLSWLIIILLFSILIERKLIAHHFQRLIPFVCLSAAVGLTESRQFVRQILKLDDRKSALRNGILLSGISSFVILSSPLPLYLKTCYSIGEYRTENAVSDVLRAAEQPGRSVASRSRLSMHHAATYISQHKTEGERVLVVATGSTNIYDELKEPVWSHFSQSVFALYRQAPHAWSDQFGSELMSASWVVFETTDVYPTLFGHQLSSFEATKAKTELWSEFERNFHPEYSSAMFVLYHRNR